MKTTQSAIDPTIHPAVSRILSDAEISRLSGHLAEQAVRNHETTAGKLHFEHREAFLAYPEPLERLADRLAATPNTEARFVVKEDGNYRPVLRQPELARLDRFACNGAAPPLGAHVRPPIPGTQERQSADPLEHEAGERR